MACAARTRLTNSAAYAADFGLDFHSRGCFHAPFKCLFQLQLLHIAATINLHFKDRLSIAVDCKQNSMSLNQLRQRQFVKQFLARMHFQRIADSS